MQEEVSQGCVAYTRYHIPTCWWDVTTGVETRHHGGGASRASERVKLATNVESLP